jgi:hypothetical protein
MSIILDALRRVEDEKKFQQPHNIDIKQKVLGDKTVQKTGFSPNTNLALMGVGFLVVTVITGALAYYVVTGMNVSKKETAEIAAPTARAEGNVAMAKNTEPVVNPAPVMEKSAPADLTEPSGRGMEQERTSRLSQATGVMAGKNEALSAVEKPARTVRRERPTQGEAVFEETPAIPSSRQNQKVISAGSEPSGVQLATQTAPEPSSTKGVPATAVSLEGIIFHTDPERRSAIVRVGGGAGLLVKIGDLVGSLKVSNIEKEKVVVVENGRKTELRMD